jgi:outer membrane immunogenic protein
MMKRSFVLGAVLTSVLAGSAMAADMPTKSPVYRPACAQFGGFYAGGQVGAAYYKHGFNDLDAFGSSQIDGDLPHSALDTDHGWLAGAQAGYNWQRNCTVFGIEADWAWTNANASSFHTDGSGPNGDSMTVTSKLRWFGTARVRTGIVVDNLLLYVTGGLAYANFKRDLTFFEDNDPTTEVFSRSRTRLGWTAGVGTEWAINANWSLKSEFLYMQFEKDEVSQTSAVIFPGTTTRFQHDDSVWVSRIGLNYRFGAPY